LVRIRRGESVAFLLAAIAGGRRNQAGWQSSQAFWSGDGKEGREERSIHLIIPGGRKKGGGGYTIPFLTIAIDEWTSGEEGKGGFILGRREKKKPHTAGDERDR